MKGPQDKRGKAEEETAGETATPGGNESTSDSPRSAERRGGEAKVTSVVLSKDVLADIEQYSWAHRVSRSEVVEEALREYFESHPPPEVKVGSDE